jgi:hypothetical protein
MVRGLEDRRLFLEMSSSFGEFVHFASRLGSVLLGRRRMTWILRDNQYQPDRRCILRDTLGLSPTQRGRYQS